MAGPGRGLVGLAGRAVATIDWGSAREEMVRHQVAGRGVTNSDVLTAMRSVPRHEFVLPEYADLAYDDRPLPIGYGQTISQPYIVGYVTAALEAGPDDRVLEVGAGSGYQSAVLAEICKAVYTLEIVPELAIRSSRTLEQLGYRNVFVIAADGHDGWHAAAPFDGIVLSAAPGAIPAPLFEQLADGGRLVAPVGEGEDQRIVRWRYTPEGVQYEDLIAVRYVPMTGGGPFPE